MKTIVVVGLQGMGEHLLEISGQIFPWHTSHITICDLSGALECIEMKRPEILLLWLPDEYESWCRGLANRLDPGSMAFWVHSSFQFPHFRFHSSNLLQSGWDAQNIMLPNIHYNANIYRDPHAIRRLIVSNLESVAFINVDEILFCKAEASYSRIIFDDQREMLISKPIKELEEQLTKDGFYRIHKSFLIPLPKVRLMHRNGNLEVELTGGIRVPMAYRKKEEFLETMKKQIRFFVA